MKTLDLSACAFETEQLVVREWHSFPPGDDGKEDIATFIAAMLTEPVTRSLPPIWQGAYSVERARHWIEERDEEGTTLLVVDKLTLQPIGLLLLFQGERKGGGGEVEVRLGYMLSEQSWGKGIASELVHGFVNWCRGESSISSIAGGVADDNPASKRVLEKNGFLLVQRGDQAADGESLYQLAIE